MGLDLGRVVADLVAAAAPFIAQLQAIERGGSRQRLALVAFRPFRRERVLFADTDGQERIAPQILVIIQIFVPQGQSIHALGEQLLQPMLHEELIAPIAETTGQAAEYAQAAIERTQQQRAAIGAQVSTRKIGHAFSWTKVLKEQRGAFTVCFEGGVRCGIRNLLHTKYLGSPGAAFQAPRMKYAG